MGRNKTRRRGRLRGIAAGLAAAAAAVMPGVAAASVVHLPDAIQADLRTTPPIRLLELAGTYPEQVLANRALRRLRAQDPDLHREILLAARFARAEIALAREVARTDEATLRVFACDCATRVAPLYERFGGRADLLEQARAGAAAAARSDVQRPAPAGPRPAGALDLAFARVEADVAALEREVASEATVKRGARSALGALVFARSDQQVSRLENAAAAAATDPPFRMLAPAMAAAEAIDQAVLVAAGGSLRRIDTVCEAVAEAVYLDHVLRGGEPSGAIDAVFRELAWQRSRLRALQASAQVRSGAACR
jgi:hypothetical protein